MPENLCHLGSGLMKSTVYVRGHKYGLQKQAALFRMLSLVLFVQFCEGKVPESGSDMSRYRPLKLHIGEDFGLAGYALCVIRGLCKATKCLLIPGLGGPLNRCEFGGYASLALFRFSGSTVISRQ